jgi:dTDP-glucose 4,6-dehydratase
MPISEGDLEHVLTHTERLWRKASGKKFFVTGGTGFFGKWLMETFAFANSRLKLGASMTVLSRDPDAFLLKYPHFKAASSVTFCCGDVRDSKFPGGHFDFVIHAATDASEQLNTTNPLLMLDTITQGTRNCLEFARLAGAGKFLLTSSGAVYGRQPSDMAEIPEDFAGASDPAHPDSAYGEGKRMAEMLCHIYRRQYDLNVSIARGFAFTGPYLDIDAHFAIGNFIRDGLRKQTIDVSGDGTPYRSYLYAADLAVWLWTILFQGSSGSVYNVGSDRAISIGELAKKVSDRFAHHPKVLVARSPVQGAAPSRYVPCVTRAKTELGLKCWIDLDEAIDRTIRFYREHGAKTD